MKASCKMVLIPALIAQSSYAAQFFVGGSAGISINKVDLTTSETQIISDDVSNPNSGITLRNLDVNVRNLTAIAESVTKDLSMRAPTVAAQGGIPGDSALIPSQAKESLFSRTIGDIYNRITSQNLPADTLTGGNVTTAGWRARLQLQLNIAIARAVNQSATNYIPDPALVPTAGVVGTPVVPLSPLNGTAGITEATAPLNLNPNITDAHRNTFITRIRNEIAGKKKVIEDFASAAEVNPTNAARGTYYNMLSAVDATLAALVRQGTPTAPAATVDPINLATGTQLDQVGFLSLEKHDARIDEYRLSLNRQGGTPGGTPVWKNVNLSPTFASYDVGIEAGAVFSLDRNFAVSAEIFADYNSLSTNSNTDVIRVRQDFRYGLKSRVMFNVADNFSLYPILGVGMMRLSVGSVGDKYSGFARLGLGGEHKLSKHFSVFTEFRYDLPFGNTNFNGTEAPINLKITTSSVMFGARYFF